MLNRRYCALITLVAVTFILWTLQGSKIWTVLGSRGGSPHVPPSIPDQPQEDEQQQSACTDFPTHQLSDVQVVLKLGASQSAEQVTSHLNHVTNCIDNLLLVSDKEENVGRFRTYDVIANLPAAYYQNKHEDLNVHDAINDPNVVNLEQAISSAAGWKLDRFKFLPMVEYAFHERPQAKWFVFVEADTYVVWDTLFQLLGQYDPTKAWYLGSPTPGRRLETGEESWFAFGGAGFVLSTAAIQKLVSRNITAGEPSISEQFIDMVRDDCCGDSSLGYALANKGVPLSGLYPHFNPHKLHGIPFRDRYWCQAVVSLHKSHPRDLAEFTKFVNKKRNEKSTMIYADILTDYHALGTFSRRANWENSDWDGFSAGDPQSPAHKSLDSCAEACYANPDCFQYTYMRSSWTKQCTFVRTIRLGQGRGPDLGWTGYTTYTAGWDTESIRQWVAENPCDDTGADTWVAPSVERIY